MARRKVEVTNNFDLFNREMRQAVEKGMGRTASKIVAIARGTTGRYPKAARYTHTIHASRAKRTGENSISIEIGYGDWKGVLFEKGTYQRKGSLKRGGDPPGPSRGIKPVRSLRTGLRKGFDGVEDNIKHEMGRWRP